MAPISDRERRRRHREHMAEKRLEQKRQEHKEEEDERLATNAEGKRRYVILHYYRENCVHKLGNLHKKYLMNVHCTLYYKLWKIMKNGYFFKYEMYTQNKRCRYQVYSSTSVNI